jgi:hypothetical protein
MSGSAPSDTGPAPEPPRSPVADELAAELLGDLVTRLGGPHIAHARRVAASVRDSGDDLAVSVALLHDVVEKGCISLADLRARSGDDRLVALVDLLTKRDDESEEQYLTRLVVDPVALSVKRADLADKQYHDDATVDGSRADELWQEAKGKLALLEQVSRAHEHGRRAQARD